MGFHLRGYSKISGGKLTSDENSYAGLRLAMWSGNVPYQPIFQARKPMVSYRERDHSHPSPRVHSLRGRSRPRLGPV